MKQFVFILFLFLILAGHSQAKNIIKQQYDFNSILISCANPVSKNLDLHQGNFIDEQDSNDIENVDGFFILNTVSVGSCKYDENKGFTIFPLFALIQVNTFLLDLPPPLLSI